MIKATFFLLAGVAITGCSSTVKNTKPLQSIATPSQVENYKLETLSAIPVAISFQYPPSLDVVMREFSEYGVKFTVENQKHIKTYKGPKDIRTDAKSALELILSSMGLDFEVTQVLNDVVYLHITPARIRQTSFAGGERDLEKAIKASATYRAVAGNESVTLGSFELSNNNSVLNGFTTASVWKRLTEEITHYKGSATTSYVKKGSFRSNMERLAKQWGFYPVIWDPRVKSCFWHQDTEYRIPKKDGREVISYYASTQDFHPVFNRVDSSVQLVYRGPQSRVSNCEN